MEKQPSADSAETNAVHPKIAEYISRAQGGENVDEMTRDLPAGMKAAVLEGIGKSSENSELTPEKPAENDVGERGLELVPRQYRPEGEPMDPNLLEEMWIVPMYVDPEKTKSELERKRRGVEAARAYHESKRQGEAAQEQAEDRLDQVRETLGLKEKPMENSPEAYSEFKVKHGPTGDGEYWWYEYRNRAAKQMKESGKFEWGKERIYFDAPTADFERLRDAAIRVASQGGIPVAFKYRDVVKTEIKGEDVDTRFVANFATAEDAARFFELLSNDPEYAQVNPDRQVDYKGIRLDAKAEYSSSYREQRGPLEKISKAEKLPDGSYRYHSDNGRDIQISAEQYEHFMKMWDELQQKMESAKAIFSKK